MQNHPLTARRTALAACLLLSSPRLLPAATFNWKNLLTAGNWSNPNAWSATSATGLDNAGVPNANATANLLFTDGTPRTVQYDYTGAATTISLLQIDLTGNPLNTATLNMTANALTVATLYTGYSGVGGTNGSGAVTQSGGTLTITPTGNGFYLAVNPTDKGAYTLSNTGAMVFNNAQSVGYAGTGTFTQTGGTYTINPGFNSLYLGFLASATGTFNLAGGSLTASCPIEVGVSGAGTFNHSAGVLALAGQSLRLGLNTGAGGTYNLSGTAALSTASGNEFVGVAGTGSFFQSGGTNTTTNLNLAFGHDTTGAYTLSAGSLTATANLVLANDINASGAFTINGTAASLAAANVLVGTANVSSGSFTQSAGTAAISGSLTFGSAGFLNLSGGTLTAAALKFVSNAATFNWTGGTLNVTTATFKAPAGQFNLLNTPFTAAFTGTDNGRNDGWIVNNIVSLAAPGTITVGTPAVPRFLLIADGAANGSLQIDHPDAALLVNGSAFVAGTSAGPQFPAGAFNLSAGTATITGSLTLWATGTLNLSGGRLSTTQLNTASNPASFNWTGGTLHLRGGTILGPAPLTIPAAGTLAGTGSLTSAVTLNGAIDLADPADVFVFNSPISGPGTISVAPGANLSAAAYRGNALSVSGFARILPTTTTAGTSKLSSLTLAGTTNNWTGRLEITTNALILQATANKAAVLSTLQNQITYGTTHTAGITSGTTNADPTHKTTVVVDNALFGATTFYGQQVDTNSLLILSTYYGDANLDRQVNVSDLGTLATYYGQSTGPYGPLHADFNNDGTVDVTDLGRLATNYGSGTNGAPFSLESDLPAFSVPRSPFPTSIPEPASLALLLPTFLRRRRTNAP